MKYCSLIRSAPHYRAEAFDAGLRAIGGTPSGLNDCDVLVIWNRYGGWHRDASAVERRGGRVIVAENGYLGNDFAGAIWYAISLRHHNGAGHWNIGGPERWDSLGFELRQWRIGGEVIVLPQRGIGPPGVSMPADWQAGACHALESRRVKYRVRAHPGMNDAIPLDQDLANAGAVVTWGSGAALKALALGVPVFHDLPCWIGAGASRKFSEFELGPKRDDEARLEMFRRLAWAMWRVDEIKSGEAFACLLGDG